MNPNNHAPGTLISPDNKPEDTPAVPPEAGSAPVAPETPTPSPAPSAQAPAPVSDPQPAPPEPETASVPVPGRGASSYTPPPTPPKRHGRRNRLLIGGGVAAVLLGSGTAFVLNQPESEDIVLSPSIGASSDVDEAEPETPAPAPAQKQDLPAPEPSPTPDSAKSPTPTPDPSPPAPAAVPLAVTVTYTDNGFSPASFTIKKGGTVTFVNNSDDNFWPDANDHPEHTLYPEFDPGKPIAAGKSWSFKFDKVGEWDYHNHLSPTKKGTITVQ